MTIHRNLNYVHNTGNAHPFSILKTAQLAGWACTRSGSGNGGVFDTDDVFAQVVRGDDIVKSGPGQNVGLGSGLEAMGSGNCWFVLRDPDGNREIEIRRREFDGDGDDDNWSIYYSRTASFTGGSATSRATAVDETQPWDSADPLFTSAGTPNLIHTAFDDSPSPAGEYGFCSVEFNNPNSLRSVISIDDLRNVAAGDPDPYCIFVDENLTKEAFYNGNAGHTWTSGAGWATGRYCWPENYHNWGRIAYDGDERHPSIICVEPTVQGYLGTSRWFRVAAVGRGYPNTGGNRQYLYVQDCSIVDLLDGSTVPAAI